MQEGVNWGLPCFWNWLSEAALFQSKLKMSRIWYSEEDGNVKTIYHYTLLLDVIDYFVNKRLVLSCNWGKFKSRMTANIYLRKKKKMGPNPQSATTRLYHLWSGGLCRTWVPCTALARLILCIYPALIHCSAAWKLLPSQEFRVVTRFMLAELARNWSWAPRCSQINHPQRERDGAVEDKQIAFFPLFLLRPMNFFYFPQ